MTERHVTTNREIARLRELMAVGVNRHAASIFLGRHEQWGLYWCRRLGIPFSRGMRGGTRLRLPPHPAPDIIAVGRLYRTMQRLRGAA